MEQGSFDRRRAVWLTALAVAAVIGVSVALNAWRSRDRAPFAPAIVEALALEHLHDAPALESADVRGDAATVNAWLASSFAFNAHVGVMEGTIVEGAKACHINGVAAALVWLRIGAHRVSLVTLPEQLREPGCTRAHGVRVCAIADRAKTSRILIGDLDATELVRLANESLL